jgi:hypothetical protein
MNLGEGLIPSPFLMIGGRKMKLSKEFKDEVMRRIRNQKNLIPIFENVYDIPQRLNEYDSTMFVVYNHKKEQFEVHSLENKGNTHCFNVENNRLDIRVLYRLYENDLRVHGKDIFRRIEQGEEKLRKQRDKEYRNFVRDFADEAQSMFAHDAWL